MDGDTIGRQPHRFTVHDYHRMAETGVLDRDARVELIRGQIVDINAIGTPHFAMVNRLTALLVPVVAPLGMVSVQNPVRLDDHSEPQPDVTVLVRREDYYLSALPGPADVLLLIEVADSSLGYDRRVKAGLYAESGIGEYWVIDLDKNLVHVHRQPLGATYRDARSVGADGMLDIAALPDITFPGSALFPGA